MQADVILKEPPPWVPPSASQGGAHVEGGGWARPPPSYATGSNESHILKYSKHQFGNISEGTESSSNLVIPIFLQHTGVNL